VDLLETVSFLAEFITFDHIYTQSLFHALLLTPFANVHDYLIFTLSIYMCWNWILLLLFVYEYQWCNNTVFTWMQDNSKKKTTPQTNMSAKGKFIYPMNA